MTVRKDDPCQAGCGRTGWYARGYCRQCYRARDWPKLPKFRDCELCGHPTRPKTVKYADAPNTRIRNGELCDPCSNAGVLVTPERARYITGELVAYLRSRGRAIEPQLLKGETS